MNRLKLWSSYTLVYLMWIMSLGLWVFFMLVSRKALAGLLGTFYLNGTFRRMKVAELIDLTYMFIIAAVGIVFIILVEYYFRHGIEKRDLIKRVGWVVGTLILFIFLCDITLALLIGFSQIIWWRWPVLLIEFTVGIGLIWLAIKGPSLTRPSQKMNFD
jgi:hypothetical protein